MRGGKMALVAAAGRALLGALGRGLRAPGPPLWARVTPRLCSSGAAAAPPPAPPAPPSPYQERPWEYLESEGYRATYGSRPVWFGYRRNHKGGVPPQRTRRACLRKGKRVGNPCPVCRDPQLLLHFRNIPLLTQFICPHSGTILHPTHTGLCMKQQKLLEKAIVEAQDHGLLWLQVPYVPVPRDDFTSCPPAVGRTPPAPALAPPGAPWYPWYERRPPPPADIACLRRIYRGYLKDEAGPAAAVTPPGE